MENIMRIVLAAVTEFGRGLNCQQGGVSWARY